MSAATLWLGRLAVTVGVVGRGDNGSNPPWLGFYYGSWLPRFSWNGGGDVFDYNWRWLCFFGSFTWWHPGVNNWFWDTLPKK